MNNRLIGILILFSLSMTNSVNAFEFSWKNIKSKLSIPTSRVYDEAKILPWDFEFKLNKYLDSLDENAALNINIVTLETLQGVSIDAKAAELIQRMPINRDNAVFLISMSDRQFKIGLNESTKVRVGRQNIEHLVALIVPQLASLNYQQAISIFSQNIAYNVASNFNVPAPSPSMRKFQGLRALAGFLLATIFIFLLGHKFIRSQKAHLVLGQPFEKKKKPLYKREIFLKKDLDLKSMSHNSDFNQTFMDLSEKKEVNIRLFKQAKSDQYPASHFRASLFLGILSLCALYFFPLEWGDPIYIMGIFGCALIVGYLSAYLKRVKRFFTTRPEMREETSQMSLENLSDWQDWFLGKNIHIYYYQLEKKVDIFFSPKLSNELGQKLDTFMKEHVKLIRKKEIQPLVEKLTQFITTEFTEDSSEILILAQDPQVASSKDQTEIIQEPETNNNELQNQTLDISQDKNDL